jgi:hypothetical protein
VAEEQVLCTAQRAKAPISGAGAAESRQHAVTADGAWDRVGTRLVAGPVSCGESPCGVFRGTELLVDALNGGPFF